MSVMMRNYVEDVRVCTVVAVLVSLNPGITGRGQSRAAWLQRERVNEQVQEDNVSCRARSLGKALNIRQHSMNRESAAYIGVCGRAESTPGYKSCVNVVQDVGPDFTDVVNLIQGGNAGIRQRVGGPAATILTIE
jgi:hypothetical protein